MIAAIESRDIERMMTYVHCIRRYKNKNAETNIS